MATGAVPGPAGSDETELITGEAVGLGLRPTSFVLRGAGALIDVVVYLLAWLLLVLAINAPVFSGLLDAAVLRAVTIGSLVFCVVVLPTAVELLTQGKSVGRLVVGARIVRDDGGAIGFRHAFIRALTGVLELFLSLGGIAALFGLLNARTKRIGDILAGTYSQYERVQRRLPAVFGVPVALVDWSRSADVARMPDPLARRIAQFLRQAGGLTPDTRVRVAAQLAAEAARFVSPLPQADPELFLAAVAAVRRERELLALQLAKQRLSSVEPVLTGLPHRFPPRR
jgi:uncharacterized RDD family membrane protein YckC